jgi:hypothetical protein
MIPYMKLLGLREAQLNQLHPSLSEPRVFYAPMSFALMLDMSLREFPDADSLKFRSTGEWKNIVHHHESVVLLPFFKKCVAIIGSKVRRAQVLAEQFYVG